MRAYLPRAVAPAPTERVEPVEGSLLFSDISGFTRLSERLARHGPVGAEEMVGALVTVFGPLIGEVTSRGGDVLKFGGDALFTLFRGPDHRSRAAGAAAAMRRRLREVGAIRTSGGTVRLSMSQGLDAGRFWLVHAGGAGFRDIVAVGPTVTGAFELESAALAGEILLGAAVAADLDRRTPGAVGHRADGRQVLLAGRQPADPVPPVSEPETVPTPMDPVAELYVPETLRGRLAEVVTESEHRTVTAAFVQFRGCDELIAGQGIGAVADRLERLLDTTTVLARRHAITVICVDAGPDGGKVMLASGAPDADEHDADAMVRFCHELIAADIGLHLRAGVNRGPAYVGLVGSPHRFTYSSMGDVVNVAARLSGRAEPGAVVAGEAVLDSLGGRFELTAMAPLSLKGKSAPVIAARVGAELPELPAATLTQAPVVGRERELAVLRELLEQLPSVEREDGPGALVELIGGPGVGKSRLLAELDPRPGIRTVRLRCDRQDSGHPYAAVAVLLRTVLEIPLAAIAPEAGERLVLFLEHARPAVLDLAPLLAVALGAEVARTDRVDAIAAEFRVPRLHDAVEELFASVADGPMLLVVEDLGHMDTASRGVLRALLRSLERRPWVVVTARRPGEPGLAADPISAAATVTELTLEPLPADIALHLATRAATTPIPRADLEGLVERSGGNPLFLLELVRAWSPETTDSLPDTVEGILAARIDRLPLAARRLLRYASVLGGRIVPELLSAALAGAEPGTPVHAGWVSARDPAVWARLDELMPPRPGGYRRFEHDLVRRVAYGALPFSRRRELHGRAARALEASRIEDPGLLARHFALADEHDACWRYAVGGADAARRTYAHGEAAELYTLAVRAARHLPDLPPAELVDVSERHGDCAERVGRYGEAGAAYTSARRLAAAADQPRLLGKHGELAERLGRYPAALGWYTKALAASSHLDDEQARSARVSLLVGRAGVRYRQGRYAEVVVDCLEVTRTARLPLESSSWARACYLLDAALTDLGRFEEAAPWRERALPVFEALGELGRQGDVLTNLGVDAYFEGRLEESLDFYRRSRTALHQAGDVVGTATADNNIAEVLSDQGELEEAEELFTEALAIWTRAQYAVGVALATSNLGRLRIRQGRAEDGLVLLESALAGFRDLHSGALATDTRARIVEALLAAGRHADAIALCDELLDPRSPPPGVTHVAAALADLRARAEGRPPVGG